ncbi:hypothetical protein SO802_017570 [Lithocarpus litseifolius]|uniref:Uncharacterized protein n=1 Tax=Lithocarpus litseifolius TaxID=425828 RepID=A0AAW2CKP3_9ROSI
MDDCLYNIGGISSKTPIAFPPNFKMSNVEKFDGTGDPKQYVRRYLSIAEMKGLDEANFACIPSFTHERLLSSPIGSFRESCDCGTRIEDAINNGQLEKDPTPIPNLGPPTWNLDEYFHFHQKPGHKTDNCFRLKQEIQDLINNGTLPSSNIITKPNIRKNPLPAYPKSQQNWVQIDEIEWDSSKLIETIEVNAVDVRGIWDDEDEILKNAEAMWGLLPKGITKLKTMVVQDNLANIIRSGKHYKPSFLEKDHPGRDIKEGSKHTESKGKEEKEEEDRVLTQLKET